MSFMAFDTQHTTPEILEVLQRQAARILGDFESKLRTRLANLGGKLLKLLGFPCSKWQLKHFEITAEPEPIWKMILTRVHQAPTETTPEVSWKATIAWTPSGGFYARILTVTSAVSQEEPQ